MRRGGRRKKALDVRHRGRRQPHQGGLKQLFVLLIPFLLDLPLKPRFP